VLALGGEQARRNRAGLLDAPGSQALSGVVRSPVRIVVAAVLRLLDRAMPEAAEQVDQAGLLLLGRAAILARCAASASTSIGVGRSIVDFAASIASSTVPASITGLAISSGLGRNRLATRGPPGRPPA
jgi:hypothetical protein